MTRHIFCIPSPTGPRVSTHGKAVEQQLWQTPKFSSRAICPISCDCGQPTNSLLVAKLNCSTCHWSTGMCPWLAVSLMRASSQHHTSSQGAWAWLHQVPILEKQDGKQDPGRPQQAPRSYGSSWVLGEWPNKSTTITFLVWDDGSAHRRHYRGPVRGSGSVLALPFSFWAASYRYCLFDMVYARVLRFSPK